MPALNRVCGWRMFSNKFHTTCVTVATSWNSFPKFGRLGTNFDKVARLVTKSRIIATNRTKLQHVPHRRLTNQIFMDRKVTSEEL